MLLAVDEGIEVTGYRCHGQALIGEQINDPFSGGVDNFSILHSQWWHGASKGVWKSR